MTNDNVEQDYISDSEDDEAERKNTQKLVQKQNRKNKKSGGFQVMGEVLFFVFILHVIP